MSTIRCIYNSAPNFPASDQHPEAVRYTVGPYIVDAIGGEPTLEQVEIVAGARKPRREQILARLSEIDRLVGMPRGDREHVLIGVDIERVHNEQLDEVRDAIRLVASTFIGYVRGELNFQQVETAMTPLLEFEVERVPDLGTNKGVQNMTAIEAECAPLRAELKTLP